MIGNINNGEDGYSVRVKLNEVIDIVNIPLTSGSSGTSGVNGSSGTSGIGTNGSSGTSGTRGTSGTSGTSGTRGTSGTSGTSGKDGIATGRTYYFKQSLTDTIYTSYKVLSDEVTISGQQIVNKNTNGSTPVLVQQFITPQLGFNAIPGGNQNFHLHFLKAAIGNNIDAYCTIQLFDTTTNTLIGTEISTNLNAIGWIDGSTPVEVLVNLTLPTTSISPTNRMVVKIYIVDQAAGSHSVNWYTEGTQYYSFVTTSVGVSSALQNLQQTVDTGNTITMPTNIAKGIDITLSNPATQYQTGVYVTIPSQTGTMSANPDAFVANISGQNPGSLPYFIAGFSAVVTGSENYSYSSEHNIGTNGSVHFKATNSFGVTSSLIQLQKVIAEDPYWNSALVFQVNSEGDATAKSFIKTDGLSSQYLMADGSTSTKTYKVYSALMTQSGSAAPVANIQENTIGNIVWTRPSAGTYVGTLTGAFTTGKVFLFGNTGMNSFLFGQPTLYTTDTIQIRCQASSGTLVDLSAGVLEIRVYS